MKAPILWLGLLRTNRTTGRASSALTHTSTSNSQNPELQSRDFQRKKFNSSWMLKSTTVLTKKYKKYFVCLSVKTVAEHMQCQNSFTVFLLLLFCCFGDSTGVWGTRHCTQQGEEYTTETWNLCLLIQKKKSFLWSTNGGNITVQK